MVAIIQISENLPLARYTLLEARNFVCMQARTTDGVLKVSYDLGALQSDGM